MRASNASTTSTGDNRRAAISAASRCAGRKLGSVLLAGMATFIRRSSAPRIRDPPLADHPQLYRLIGNGPYYLDRTKVTFGDCRRASGFQIGDAHDGDRPA